VQPVLLQMPFHYFNASAFLSSLGSHLQQIQKWIDRYGCIPITCFFMLLRGDEGAACSAANAVSLLQRLGIPLVIYI